MALKKQVAAETMVPDEDGPSGATEAALSEAWVQDAFASSGYELTVHPAHVIRRAHQRATMHFQEVMGEHDLTPTQMAALATIMRHGEVSQNQLGRLTAMDPSTISIVIRKLAKNGLVERSASAEDQRLSLIRLSEAGLRYTAPLLAKSVEAGRRVLAPLKPSERALFMEMLVRVADGEPNTDN
ncbi:MarR family transcriptional regulator [Kaistia dalseonensis]|uniref:DNA-binding MarR family transcriptional regulator n=1 Tax=Kaistia dalseonensis TaxID=410840 RepID=A0ABU0HCX5_9HYPH|nr:MarR family transcriptional regulator [Kaistia dalseonensis]MCX5496750.1 MarR family transcriptional regulator [Kaistia dalseonensis]MDQ0439376.1 DNA-binding MarR family transcriptional regulator [Kaistia dalseonensis]